LETRFGKIGLKLLGKELIKVIGGIPLKILNFLRHSFPIKVKGRFLP